MKMELKFWKLLPNKDYLVYTPDIRFNAITYQASYWSWQMIDLLNNARFDLVNQTKKKKNKTTYDFLLNNLLYLSMSINAY